MDRFSTVTHLSVSISWISVMLLSVAGYMTFTGHTLGNAAIILFFKYSISIPDQYDTFINLDK